MLSCAKASSQIVQHTNFRFGFPFTLLQNLLSLVSKNMFALIVVFVAKKFTTQPFFVYCNVCCLVQTQVPLKTVQHTNFHLSFFYIIAKLIIIFSKNMFA